MLARNRRLLISTLLSVAAHAGVMLALRSPVVPLAVLQPGPILVQLYEIGRQTAGPGVLGPVLSSAPLAAPARVHEREPSTLAPVEPTKHSRETPRPQQRAKPLPPAARASRPQPSQPVTAAEVPQSEDPGGSEVASATASGPSAGAAAAGAGGNGAMAPAAADSVRVSYEQQLFQWLERFKQYPMLARRRHLEGEGVVRVRIDRRGRVQARALERATGVAMLDDAALEIVSRADPFPPIPPGYAGDGFEFLAPIVFRLQ